MSWWQEVLQMLAILGWWQIILILIAVILVGIFASSVIFYLILRYVFKDHISYSEVISLLSIRIKKPATNLSRIMKRKGRSPPSFPVIHPHNKIRDIILQRNNTITNLYSDSSNPVSNISNVTPQLAPTSEVESNPLAMRLIVELDDNLRIINEFNGRKLSPLQNKAWLAHLFSNNKFSIDLENQLEQVYLAISAWNNMLWISTELNHQTDFSNERYQKSLLNISERLKIIRQIIK